VFFQSSGYWHRRLRGFDFSASFNLIEQRGNGKRSRLFLVFFRGGFFSVSTRFGAAYVVVSPEAAWTGAVWKGSPIGHWTGESRSDMWDSPIWRPLPVGEAAAAALVVRRGTRHARETTHR